MQISPNHFLFLIWEEIMFPRSFVFLSQKGGFFFFFCNEFGFMKRLNCVSTQSIVLLYYLHVYILQMHLFPRFPLNVLFIFTITSHIHTRK